ncbi:MAG: hypothetical protein E4H03_14460 [Myxococcales bacterium]|nr:MAG: hypothetical protein E4H03_14460 [Myxococcales bacterium]
MPKLAMRAAPALLCVAVAVQAASGADVDADSVGRPAGGALSPPAAERVIATAPVPDDERPHGEVTLLVRGRSSVVETFLHSRLLRRVVAESVLKEEANWPRDGRHGSDSLAYAQALESAEREIWRKHQRDDRRRATDPVLVIELTVSETGAGLALFELPVGAPAERASLESRTVVARPALAREYLERNFYRIIEDALAIAPTDAAGRLRAAGGWAPPVPAPEVNP